MKTEAEKIHDDFYGEHNKERYDIVNLIQRGIEQQTASLTKQLEYEVSLNKITTEVTQKHINEQDDLIFKLQSQLSESKALVEEKYQIIANYMQTVSNLQSQINTLTEEREAHIRLERKNIKYIEQLESDIYHANANLDSLELAHKQEREKYDGGLTYIKKGLKFITEKSSDVDTTYLVIYINSLISPQAKEFNFKCYGEMGGHGRCDELCKNCLTKYPENTPQVETVESKVLNKFCESTLLEKSNPVDAKPKEDSSISNLSNNSDAVGFVKWIKENYTPIHEDTWVEFMTFEPELTTLELYNLFKIKMYE